MGGGTGTGFITEGMDPVLEEGLKEAFEPWMLEHRTNPNSDKNASHKLRKYKNKLRSILEDYTRREHNKGRSKLNVNRGRDGRDLLSHRFDISTNFINPELDFPISDYDHHVICRSINNKLAYGNPIILQYVRSEAKGEGLTKPGTQRLTMGTRAMVTPMPDNLHIYRAVIDNHFKKLDWTEQALIDRSKQVEEEFNGLVKSSREKLR